MEKPIERLTPRPLATLIRQVRPLGEDDDMATATARVAEAGGGLPVADRDGRLVGYLSERDVLEALFPAYLRELRQTAFLTRDFPSLIRRAREAAATRVAEHMSREPVFVDSDDSESHAAELFLHHDLRTLPVIDGEERVIGVVRVADLAESLLTACGAIRASERG